MEMKRIYHSWEKWEDYKAGFYNNASGKDKSKMIEKVIELFTSPELTKEFMNKAIKEWYYSCEHNLTNNGMNKIAYIGQAACCLYAGIPNLVTMYAWKYLNEEIRFRSDKIAKITILKWEQKKKLEITLKAGSLKDMKMEYQTKLLLN